MTVRIGWGEEVLRPDEEREGHILEAETCAEDEVGGSDLRGRSFAHGTPEGNVLLPVEGQGLDGGSQERVFYVC